MRVSNQISNDLMKNRLSNPPSFGKVEETKIEFLKQKFNEISIGNRLSTKVVTPKRPLDASDLQCLTIDAQDIDNMERTCHISELD